MEIGTLVGLCNARQQVEPIERMFIRIENATASSAQMPILVIGTCTISPAHNAPIMRSFTGSVSFRVRAGRARTMNGRDGLGGSAGESHENREKPSGDGLR